MSEARAEAERRYSGRGEVPLTAGAIRNARREAFERGAEWQATRKIEVTDQMVIAAIAAHFETPGNDDVARMRAALTAALEAQP